MKEQIYTIPVIDAFKEDTECPFCEILKKLEKESIDFMLGASYMEDDIRMETNKMGFCPRHYEKMFKEKNRLGLAFMLHTHIETINKNLPSLLESDISSAKSSLLSSLTKKMRTSENKNPTIKYLEQTQQSCYICNKIEHTFDRYVDTFFYLWKKDKNFITLVENGKGFCLNHFRILLDQGMTKLNNDQYTELFKIIIPIQLENLKRIEEELDWFVKKYDYRYNNEPWKNSKDAIPRSIQKIASTYVDE